MSRISHSAGSFNVISIFCDAPRYHAHDLALRSVHEIVVVIKKRCETISVTILDRFSQIFWLEILYGRTHLDPMNELINAVRIAVF